MDSFASTRNRRVSHSHNNMDSLPRNRGTGAGGARTNETGLAFEAKTSNEQRLTDAGYVRKSIPKCKGKFAYYLESADGRMLYFTQRCLRNYTHAVLGIELFRNPDEAYLYRKDDGTYVLYVLEKKNQTVEGSVDTKLCAGSYFVEEYSSALGDRFTVQYAFCIADFLKQKYVSDDKKWCVMRDLHRKHGIAVLFGDDADYFTKLDEWLSTPPSS